MSHIITKNPDGSFKIELAVPESHWVDMLAHLLQTNDVTILSIAVGGGMLDLVCKFISHDDMSDQCEKRKTENERSDDNEQMA